MFGKPVNGAPLTAVFSADTDGGDAECDLSCNDGFTTCSLNGQCAALPNNTCSLTSDCCGGLCQDGFCCAMAGTPCGTASDCNTQRCTGAKLDHAQDKLADRLLD